MSVDSEGWELKTCTEVRTSLEQKLAQAETVTGKSPSWVFQTGRNILKISLDLEKEVAKGEINIDVASEIVRIPDKETREKVTDYVKKVCRRSRRSKPDRNLSAYDD